MTALMVRAPDAKSMVAALQADQLIGLALAIADDNVRSEVELYARRREIDGLQFFDTSTPVTDSEDGAADLAVVQRALAYIKARGEVFPWRLKRHIAHPALVRFEEKTDGDH